MNFFVTSLVLAIVSKASANSLTCNEGFNGDIGGVPFYHWTDRNCSEKSDCFMQELSLKVFKTEVEVNAKYGGCISSDYAPMLTCENLFGVESTFDPARLLDMMPDLEDKFRDFLEDLRHDSTSQIQRLFSAGNGSEEFIEGLMTFTEHLGFDMDKVRPLKEPMAKCWHWMLAFEPTMTYDSYMSRSYNLSDELLVALGKLDTKNTKIAEYILSFIGNWADEETINEIRDSKFLPLLENLPELVKSTLPVPFKASRWYDDVFELLGDIRIAEPKESAFNAIKKMKTMVEIPKEYSKYLDPVFDSAPELVEHMVQGDYMYAGTWSVTLLESESETNSVTNRLSTAIFKFISTLTNETIPSDINTLITWFPGVVYKFFDQKDVDRIYNELSAGFEATDIRNPTKTLATTKMSDFFVKFTDNFIEYSPNDPDSGKPEKNLLVINFCKTFYNIMTSEYTDDLDIIFETLSEGFKNYPDFDIGKIVHDLIVNLGWKVPDELQPFLNTAQGLLNSMINGTYDVMRDAAEKVIQEYEKAYPKSEFPDLVRRFIDVYHTAFVESEEIAKERREAYSVCDFQDPDWYDCYQRIDGENRAKEKEVVKKMYKKLNDLSVDTSFAVFRLMDYKDDYITSFAIEMFPQYATYIRLMRVLDPSDVKELLNDYTLWLLDVTFGRNYTLLTTSHFVAAVNETVYKITSKLGDVTKELRNMFAPDSCKYEYCSGDRCNSYGSLEKIPAFSPPPSIATPTAYPKKGVDGDDKMDNTGKDKIPATVVPMTTTSSSSRINVSIMLNIAALWMGCKVIFG